MRYFDTTALLTALFLIVSPAQAHEGHDHGPEEHQDAIPLSGPVTISPEARRNLALELVEAQIRPLDRTVTVIGQIEGIPSRSAAVTSRIAGRVTALLVSEGTAVRKGDALIEVESRQPGEPPPRVRYTAPIDGIITHRHTALGDPVDPDKHLMQVTDLSEVYAEGRIYEGQLRHVQVGQSARVVVESYPDRTFSGTVELLGGSLDEETRTLQVWIRIQNEAAILRPNMRATIQIITAHTESTTAIPKSAVLGENGNYFVFVQSDSNELEFQRRRVVVGMRDDQYIEILEGVFPSDRVVTVGNYQLQYIPSSPAAASRTEPPPNEPSHSTSTCSWWLFALGAVIGALVTGWVKRSRG